MNYHEKKNEEMANFKKKFRARIEYVLKHGYPIYYDDETDSSKRIDLPNKEKIQLELMMEYTLEWHDFNPSSYEEHLYECFDGDYMTDSFFICKRILVSESKDIWFELENI